MDSHTQKYRPTKHNMWIIFKRDSLVSNADDMDIPIESFDFVATKEILSSVRDDLFLIGMLFHVLIVPPTSRLIGLGSKHSTSVDVIGRVVRHSPSEDFLSLTPYAPIHQIKQTLEKSTYVTCGMVINIDRDHAWWYKTCRQCTQGLEALTDQFYCAKCDVYSTIFVPRLVSIRVWFCIQVRVVDDSDTATFVLFENSASKFLGLFVADIRTSLLARGYGRDRFPEELNALIGKTLLFKLTIRHDSLNKFQACVITISRICSDPETIALLALKKNIKFVWVFDYSTKAVQLALRIQLLLHFVFLNILQSDHHLFQDALQKLTTVTGVRSGDLIGTGSIGVAGSTTPLSTKAAIVSELGANHVVT
ncbi:hypothetical protein Ahy_A10g050409 [Arachis hypogaea]|uniref:Replication factor A C-terminal domain-containing protein n=1 Tax=Arachis hypogaea TaxID=3818 RepID=A0A445B9A5_ARAHY|nr:hypothetical protein Ahy_A10g050409 [Arachis hypogaea]